jgi:hypothetical protein
MANAIWVGHWNENNSGTEGLLDIRVAVGLIAVGQANAVLVRIEQVRDEVDEVVGTPSFAGVDLDKLALTVRRRCDGKLTPEVK